jgi:cell growth-regulating nucleolar protein
MDYEDTYSTAGYTYGSNPIPGRESEIEYHEIVPREYRTPAPKARQTTHRNSVYSDLSSSVQAKSTDKKRKRQVEELDLTAARRSQSLDAEMVDADTSAPPPLEHSGLTGGLNRLLSKSKFPPSPEYSDPSPIGDGKKIVRVGVVREIEKGRGRTTQGQLVKVRKVRRPSDESRPRKHHRSHRHSDESRPHDRTHSEHTKKKVVKAIEYPGHSNHSSGKDDSQQMVLYRSRAELFLSFVTKGPDSDRGCSVNKALKRYHRERGEQGLGLGKAEEEKELWKSIRLKRNERGEVVVIF